MPEAHEADCEPHQPMPEAREADCEPHQPMPEAREAAAEPQQKFGLVTAEGIRDLFKVTHSGTPEALAAEVAEAELAEATEAAAPSSPPKKKARNKSQATASRRQLYGVCL